MKYDKTYYLLKKIIEYHTYFDGINITSTCSDAIECGFIKCYFDDYYSEGIIFPDGFHRYKITFKGLWHYWMLKHKLEK